MKLFVVATVLMAGMVHSNAWTQTNWSLAAGYRAETFHGKNLAQFVQEIEQATKGSLKITLHSNNSLVKLNDISAAVQSGKLDAGESIMTSLAKDMPIAGADAVPFVVTSYADAQRLWQFQRPLIEKTFAQRGLKPLYAVPWPPQNLYSKKQITGVQDFKGAKMRTYNATTLRIAELLGASGVDVPMVEVGKALNSGRIDSMITSAVTGVENRVWSDIKYYYEINAWFPKNIVFVNLSAFKALKPDAQSALLKAAQDAENRGWAMSEKAATESTNELKSNGIKIERIPADLNATLKRLGEKFSREWVTGVGNDANEIFMPYYFGVASPAPSSTLKAAAAVKP